MGTIYNKYISIRYVDATVSFNVFNNIGLFFD